MKVNGMANTEANGLTYSTTRITSTTPGEVIQNLDLYVTGDTPAINVTSDDVTIKNVRIHTTTGDGVDVWGNNATLSNVEVDGPTPNGQAGGSGDGTDGVYAYNVNGLKADHLTFRDMGTGVNAVQSPGTALNNIEGFDFQGPFPSGQLVQFNNSNGSSLTDFYSLNNSATSHPEDVVSVAGSQNVSISNGVIDGDNSPSGVGVMFEENAQGGTVKNVDAIHMGNGAFSSYSDGVTFDNTRSFDNIASDQGRGKPMSNALIWNLSGANVVVENSTYTNAANPDNITSQLDFPGDAVNNVTQASGATPMTPINNVFAWSDPSAASVATSDSGTSGSPSSDPSTSAPSASAPSGSMPSTSTSSTSTPSGAASVGATAPDPASSDPTSSASGSSASGSSDPTSSGSGSGSSGSVAASGCGSSGSCSSHSGSSGSGHTFVFTADQQSTTIQGFHATQHTKGNGTVVPHSVLALAHSLFDGAQVGESGCAASQLIADHSICNGQATVITTDTGQSITLPGVNRSTLLSHPSDFRFT